MFDIGFTEVIFIMVIALLVVGPERLPRIARTAGLWIGKMRGFVSSVKADIDRELATDELRKALDKQTALPEIEELVDEITGDPIKAGERTIDGPASAKPVENLTEETPDEPDGKAEKDN
jgi:sec-independent protein translocase protein TatB